MRTKPVTLCCRLSDIDVVLLIYSSINVLKMFADNTDILTDYAPSTSLLLGVDNVSYCKK